MVKEVVVEPGGGGWIVRCGHQEVTFTDFDAIAPAIPDLAYRFDVSPSEVLKAVTHAREEKERNPLKIKVADLEASLIGRKVEVNVQIAGEAEQKAVPKKVRLECTKCEHVTYIDFDELGEVDRKIYLEVVVFHDKPTNLTSLPRARHTLCDKGRPHHFNICVEEYMDFSILFVRDLLDPLARFDQRVYKNRKIYLINRRLPYAKKVTVQGTVFIEPSNRDITIIADECIPFEDEASNFTVTEQDKEAWNQYFRNNSTEEMLPQIAPSMIGRPLVQEALHLALHSIAELKDIYGKPIRGCLHVLFFGDTKTFKSNSVRDLTIDHYHFGDFIIGESSSRTGLTYTIDADNKALIWGALPMNDLGFLGIDGMHSLCAEEWRETREALEKQSVVVRRSQSGEALARTRVVGIFNPNKPMNQYLFKCQGVTDTFFLSNPPDVTRWDVFIPFSSQDVEKAEIAMAKPKERPIPDEVYIRHVFWALSRRPDHVEYTQEAREAIIKETTFFMDRYATDSLPIVHLGFREVLTRIAVAYAAWLHSTDLGYEKIVVKKKHVDRAKNFLVKVFEALELESFKLEEEGKLKITGRELDEMISELDQVSLRIIEAVKLKAKSSSQLAEDLDVSIRTIKRRYAILTRHGLIQTKPGEGITLSPRGIIFLKNYLGVKVPNSDTSKGEKMPKNDTLTPGPPVEETENSVKDGGGGRGFSFGIDNLDRVVQKGPPKKSEAVTEKIGRSSPDIGNLGNLGKNRDVGGEKNVKTYTVEKGASVNIEKLRKWRNGETPSENGEKTDCRNCKHLGRYRDDPRPFCNWLQSFLSEESMKQSCEAFTNKGSTTCGSCKFFRSKKCVMEQPDLILPSATYASSCNSYKPRSEGEK